MILPPRLRPGDPVAIVAPAGPVPEARLAKGIATLAARYDLHWSRRVFDKLGYLAGSDEARRGELTMALADPSLKAIFCARGGYGITRLLADLDPQLLIRHPKVLVGFSDITALHAWATHSGVASLHGPVATQLGELSDGEGEALFELLEGKIGRPFTGLESIGKRVSVEGPLLGGNLELVTRMLGTPYAFPLDGAVLLLEEVGERPYRIDRSLTQLRLAGAFARVAAVVVGELVRCDEPDGSGPSAAEVVGERLSGLGIPVLRGLPIGHGTANHPIGHGVAVRVDGERGELVPLAPVTA